MTLQELWFALIAILWMGYLFLEGFDFGVGMLLPFLGRDDLDRRVMLNSIGPFWDGNEVWLIVAGGATFAAFPEWYATLFSGFYLALLLILVALIVRAVAFEWRGKDSGAAWRRRWDRAIFVGSAVPALLWGVAFANFVSGVPINANHDFTGTLLDLLHPYALLGGLVTLSLCALHGALFLSLKTEGAFRERARVVAGRLLWPARVCLLVFLAWSCIASPSWALVAVSVVAVLAVVAAGELHRRGSELFAFFANGLAIALFVVAIFVDLYPRVLVSSTSAGYSLTITNASSSGYTLTVMTIVALVFTPFVLLYQGWTYWVFRKRIRRPA